MQMMVSMLVALGVGLITYANKWRKGEQFEGRKLMRTAVVGIVLGAIAWKGGYSLTADNWDTYLAANAGTVAVIDQLVKLASWGISKAIPRLLALARILLLALACILIMPAWTPRTATAAEYGLLNLSGTTYYLPMSQAFAVGGGVDVATFYDGLFALRGEAAVTVVDEGEGENLYGGGVRLDLPKLITRIGGSWLAGAFNPSLNAAVLVGIGEDGELNPQAAIGVNIITVEFGGDAAP